jgi:type II secretory pathway component PulL
VRDFSSQPRRRPSTTAEKVVVGVAALVLAASGVHALGAWQESRRVQARVQQARGEAQAALTRAQAFESRRDAGQVLAAQAVLTADAPPSRVVAELSRLMPGDVKLDDLRLVYGSRLQVEMRVSARVVSSYDMFLDRLERSPSFTEVLPGDENREGELRAVVRAVWRGAGA